MTVLPAAIFLQGEPEFLMLFQARPSTADDRDCTEGSGSEVFALSIYALDVLQGQVRMQIAS
jgi:hypothetical protein